MADYIVGDIQGCFKGLQALLKSVQFNPAEDKLYAVGDVIGRGPDSLATLEYLYALGDSFDTVLGNHDLHLLAIFCGIRKAKASDKLDELLASPHIERYIQWLRHKPLAMQPDENTLLCHAGLYPQWSIAQALALSQECSDMLRSEQWQNALASMYGNQPDSWSAQLSGEARWRFIVNAFTRMRYMHDSHRLDFVCKDAPAQAPASLSPWFAVNNPHLQPQQQVVFGHWATLAGQTNQPQYIALDTGYVWGLRMTMWHLQSRNKFSISFQE